MVKKLFYVYVHRFSNGTLYVGKGFKKRARQFYGRNSYWNRVRAKYGSPIVRVIFKDLTEKESLDIEVETIKRFKDKGKTLCNLTSGGDGVTGMKRTRKSKEEYSKKYSKKFHFVRIDGTEEFVGYQWEFVEKTGAYDANVSALCVGKSCSMAGWRLSHTKEWGLFGSRHPFFGKPLPDSVKHKISESTSGDKNHNYSSKIINFYNEKTGDKFTGTQKELADYSGHGRSGFSQMISGKINSFHGWLPTGRTYRGKASGERNKNHNPTIYSFQSIETGIVYTTTQNDFRKRFPRISHSEVSAICRGKRKTSQGFRCLDPIG
jgi:hypothetical protein